MADYWPDLYNDPYAVKRIQNSVELAQVQEGMSVLDVGCHRKELLNYLPTPIHYCGLDAIYGDKLDGGFEVGSNYDRIFCLETLEHLQFPDSTLIAIKHHLLPNGLAVISLPNEATLFHRVRALFGVVDAECFSEKGKHLHLPSLKQATTFIQRHFEIVRTGYYISPSAAHSQQAWLGKWLRILPDSVWQRLADVRPSLFSRGFIFVCKKK